MPAQDQHHEIVGRSLEKAGWQVVDEQVYISIGDTPETRQRFFIDLHAQSSQGMVVLIEIKSLDRSLIHQLMELLGQYLVYRTALDFLEITLPLYVAVPHSVYLYGLGYGIGELILERYQVPVVTYDPVLEVIIEWIPQP
ncbi:MAG: hypothetical protein GYB68_03045 [Chloroflexi bacterium]|nr:hypothetical protein [Chloroflexota bacterium]